MSLLAPPWSSYRQCPGKLRSSSRTLSLRIEELEQRIVADASVALTGATLMIRGTDQAEVIHISRVTTPDGPAIEVTGLGHSGNPTSFNGGKRTEVLTGSFDHIDAELGGGDDHLVLRDIATPRYPGSYRGGWLNIDGEEGNDLVELHNMSIAGTTEVQLGTGRDVVAVQQSIFRGRSIYHGGPGTDTFTDLGGNRLFHYRLRLGFEHSPTAVPGTNSSGRPARTLTASGHPMQIETAILSDGAILETLEISDGSSSLGTWTGRALVYVAPDGLQTWGVLTMRFSRGHSLMLGLRNKWVEGPEHPHGAFLGTYQLIAGSGRSARASGSGTADVLFLRDHGDEVLLRLDGDLRT